MSERTALEIADKFDELASIMRIHNVPTLPKLHEYGKKATDMLRQQHAEIGRLARKNAAYASLTKAQDAELSLHRDRAAAYRAAVKHIDSEREANAILTAERDAAISAAVAAEREEHAAEIDRLKRERHHIYDLLARIHRDGGQYAAEHGVEKACDDAEAQVVTWIDTISGIDELIEQARIADRAANSMLIAAAPDLLEVCRRLSHVSLFAVDEDVASIIMLALDTVQKATGEKP